MSLGAMPGAGNYRVVPVLRHSWLAAMCRLAHPDWHIPTG